MPRGNHIVGFFSQNRPLCLFQGFAGEVNDPLRVRIFIGRSLGGLVGGIGGVIFPGDSVVLLGSLGNPVPVRVPNALPNGPILVIRLTCLGGGLPPSLVGGRAVLGLLPSPGRTAWGAYLPMVDCFLPGREGAQLPGNCSFPGKEVEQWPERMEVFAGDWDLLLPEQEGEV